MIETPNPAFFNSPQGERRSAMDTELVENPERTVFSPEYDEVLSQQPGCHHRTGLAHLVAGGNRHPVTPKQLSHGGTRTDPAQPVILLARQHSLDSSATRSVVPGGLRTIQTPPTIDVNELFFLGR